MASTAVRLERSGRVGVLWLDRPPVNALDIPLLEELESALQRVESEEMPALVLAAQGRCFSGGLDLKQLAAADREHRERFLLTLNRMLALLYGLPRPVVAAINGHAVAGGMVLALSCDHRVCTRESVRLGLSEVRGGIPFPVAPWAIVKTELSTEQLRRMAVLGHDIANADAQAQGVIDELVAPADVVPRAIEVAHELASLPRAAFAAIKLARRHDALRCMQQVLEAGQDPALEAWSGTDFERTVTDLLRPPRR